MSPQHDSRPSVRRRLASGAAAAAAALAVASPVSAYFLGHDASPTDLRADIGAVLQAAKVSSRATATAVTITVTAPHDQPPGVTYTVVRVTNRGEATVCAGTAPLTCTDPVGRPGTAVSYTVVSSLTGHGKATTALDVITAPAPRPTRASTTPDDVRRAGAPSPEPERSTQRSSASIAVVALASPTPSPSSSPTTPSPSPSPGTPSPSPSPGTPSPSATGSPSPTASPTEATTPATSSSGGDLTGPTLTTTSTAPTAGPLVTAESTSTRRS